MGKETILFSSEEKKDLADVAAFLHTLADKLGDNQVILRQGAEELTIEIPNNVVLEIKVEEELKKNKTKQSLEIEIEWIPGEEAPSGVELG
jgi:amphi-Trp domain-containing protein